MSLAANDAGENQYNKLAATTLITPIANYRVQCKCTSLPKAKYIKKYCSVVIQFVVLAITLMPVSAFTRSICVRAMSACVQHVLSLAVAGLIVVGTGVRFG